MVVPRASVGGGVTCGLPVAPPTAPVGVTVEGSTLLAGVGEGDETGVGVGVGDELGEVKKQPFAVVHGGVGCVGSPSSQRATSVRPCSRWMRLAIGTAVLT